MAYLTAELGRTGLQVGRLGVASSYGAPAPAIEQAFEEGVNYFYWGSIRRDGLGQALRNLAPQRDRMVLAVQSYTRIAGLMGWSVERALRKVRFEFADILLLGYWNSPLPPRIMDAALRLRERGLVRHLGISSHNRPLIASMLDDSRFDVFHLRYNAQHPGAEKDIFPRVPKHDRPGLVAYTATSWKQLLDPKRTPPGERVPTATDCYRFVMSNPAVDVCMSGPADAAQMNQALDALRFGPMPVEELAWMRRVGAG